MYARTSDRPSSTQLVILLVITAAIAFMLATPASAQRRPRSHLQAARPNPPATAASGLVTHDLATGGETARSLVAALVGPGPVISNIQYTGRPFAAGTFGGGTGIVGFESGIILSSGDIARVLGPVNTTTYAGIGDADWGNPGDPDLDALLPAGLDPTLNASVLEFDLECATETAISFQYVFASDEYDGLGDESDDLFACFVNGQNIALIPGTQDPISLRTVNCSYPTGGVNCEFYMTNDCDTLGLGYPCSHIATEMDGLTVVLTAVGTLQPGPNHVKLAIADSGDPLVDSNVFIRGHSLVCAPGAPVFEAPSSCEQILNGWVDLPFGFDVAAWAANNLPGAAVALDVTGDAVPLAGGTFTPALPTSAAQPGSTHFDWTPTLADVGLYHLFFTATDQIQNTATLDVALRISPPAAPVFDPPSPCGQVLQAFVGAPFAFAVNASAWMLPGCQQSPGQSVVLSVTGDAVPLDSGVFDPPLPAGPGQPVSTQFRWTPTAADVGLYHLEFTAIDGLQHASSCGVDIQVTLPPPIFELPSTCGQTRDAYGTSPFRLDVRAAATNGESGQSVLLSVAGDPVPLANGTFTPPLPAGPSQPVSTRFEWTPTLADEGLYHLEFTATDQFQVSRTCGVDIRVHRSPATDLCQPGTGAVIACPCSNAPAHSPAGCDNSAGTGGARLDSVGIADPDQYPGVVFTTTGEPPTALSVVFQGKVLLSAGAVYGQGVRCVGGSLKRLYVKSASGGSIAAPQAGEVSVWDRSCLLGDCIGIGTKRYYGVYYRDPTVLGGCPPLSTFNITQTQEIVWHY